MYQALQIARVHLQTTFPSGMYQALQIARGRGHVSYFTSSRGEGQMAPGGSLSP